MKMYLSLLKNRLMRYLVLVVFCTVTTVTVAQRNFYENSSPSLKDRGYVGLGLSGLNFGRDFYLGRFFSIGGSGQLGYMLTKNFSTGVGLEYTYTTYSDQGIKHHVYGGYPFLRYNVFNNFFVQTDYNLVTIKVTGPGGEASQNFERFFVGAGYSSPSGNRSYFNMLVSYDFLFTNTSPFASPLSFRFFFTIGFSN
jgi:hypothetical protein